MAKAHSNSAGKITIQSVADLAGVSIATVSRVLSGNLNVREDFIQKVRDAAATLNYTPSASAQGLAKGRNFTVGILVPDLSNPYFPDVVKGIHNLSTPSNYRLLIADSDGTPEDEISIIRDMLRQVDGIILISPRMSIDDLKSLENAQSPVVLINRMEPGVGLPSVGVDNFSAMSELIGHLASLGHKRIAFLSGPKESWQQRERGRAVLHASNFGISVEEITTGGSISDGVHALDIAMKSKPTAAICFNDLVALGVLSRAAELGIRIPEDLSVTGFDDIEFSSFSNPTLTTIRSPQIALGEAAWKILEGELSGKAGNHQPLMGAQVVIRNSTGKSRK
jgi:LacI family repressor for deo operon, udp, cdd, tsx, nupC, and nupG